MFDPNQFKGNNIECFMCTKCVAPCWTSVFQNLFRSTKILCWNASFSQPDFHRHLSPNQGRNQLFISGGDNFHELPFNDVIVLIQT